MSKATVLVGFAEAMSAPEAVWSLVDAGFKVIAFARKGRTSALRHSRHVTFHEICSPESDIQQSLSDLNALLESLDGAADDSQLILFPLDDKAVWLCSKAKLSSNWLLAGPHDSTADLALNKHLQVQKAAEAGFNVPASYLAKTADEVRAASRIQPFPIILKADECVPTYQGRLYSCRKWICANTEELEKALSEWQERTPLLVQQYVVGTGEGVFGLAAPEAVRSWSAHRRLRMMNPQGSGSSACISQTVSEEIKTKVQALVTATKWQGLFMVELLRDNDGNLWFVELNGRPWGSISLSRRQGLEYPAWHVNLALDPQSKDGAGIISAPGLVCRNVGREFMHLLFVLKGPKSKALQGWSSFWTALVDVVRIRRGDTFYNWRPEDINVFLADCCYTVRDNVFKSRI